MKRLIVGVFMVVVVALSLSFSLSVVMAQEPCEGNFDCDQDMDVDGTDAAVFKSDFGRSQFNDPCPSCYDSICPCTPCLYGMVDCGNKCIDPMETLWLFPGPFSRNQWPRQTIHSMHRSREARCSNNR